VVYQEQQRLSPAMEDDRSFVYEMTQHMFEAYRLAWQKVKPDARRWLRRNFLGESKALVYAGDWSTGYSLER
jgi:hypothetical protein